MDEENNLALCLVMVAVLMSGLVFWATEGAPSDTSASDFSGASE